MQNASKFARFILPDRETGTVKLLNGSGVGKCEQATPIETSGFFNCGVFKMPRLLRSGEIERGEAEYILPRSEELLLEAIRAVAANICFAKHRIASIDFLAGIDCNGMDVVRIVVLIESNAYDGDWSKLKPIHDKLWDIFNNRRNFVPWPFVDFKPESEGSDDYEDEGPGPPDFGLKIRDQS